MAVEFHRPPGWDGWTKRQRCRWLTCAADRLLDRQNNRSAEVNRTVPADVRAWRRWLRRYWGPRQRIILGHIARIRVTIPDPSPGPIDPNQPNRRFDRASVRLDLTNAEKTAMEGQLDTILTGQDPISSAVDPTEDYTGYSTVGTDYTVTDANTITMTGMTETADNYVYSDKGAAHFGTAFDHLADGKIDGTSDDGSNASPWGVSNTLNDFKGLFDNLNQALITYMTHSATSNLWRIIECEDQDFDQSIDVDAYEDNFIFANLVRDGVNGVTLTNHLWNTAARDDVNIDNIVVTPPASRTYRYVFGLNNWNDGGGDDFVGVIENLDLQEPAVGHPAVKRMGGIPYAHRTGGAGSPGGIQIW